MLCVGSACKEIINCNKYKPAGIYFNSKWNLKQKYSYNIPKEFFRQIQKYLSHNIPFAKIY